MRRSGNSSRWRELDASSAMGEAVVNELLVKSLLIYSSVVFGLLCRSTGEGEGAFTAAVRGASPLMAAENNGTWSRSCYAQDEATLLQLANDYKEFRGWNPADCCRSWGHVTLLCSNSSKRWERRVTSISVPFLFRPHHFNLRSFPPAICNLTALTTLELPNAGLSGPFPPCLSTYGSLPRLSVLDLSYNFLSGPLPVSLLSLRPSLRSLDVFQNSLSGSLPSFTSNSSALQIFVASYNFLNGSIPASVEAMQSLTILSLSLNLLSGIIPPQLGSLSNLEYLELSLNRLSGTIPPQLGSLSNLKSLGLSSNHLSGTIPPQLGSLSNLENLFLSSNRLSSTIPPQLGSFPHLIGLALSENELDPAPFPAFLGNLSGLQSLSLSHNSFNSAIPAEWQNLTNLEILDLSGNALSAHPTLPDWLFHLPLWYLALGSLNLTSSQFSCDRLKFLNDTLEVLRISNNHLSAHLQCLSQISFPILVLDLSHNNLSGSIPSAVSNNIWYLDLSFNAFTGMILPHLANYTSLQVLKLASNHFTKTIPPELGTLSRLRTMSLHHNLLEGAIPFALSNCSSLRVLDLSYNLLHGDLDKTFPFLSSLRVLMLDYNNLSGPIPASLGSSSPLLQVLGLSGNLLTGTIPPHLDLPGFKLSSPRSTLNTLSTNTLHEEVTLIVKGMELHFTYILTVLTSIDFSSNMLAGSIPPQLGDLQGLVYLNLSRNNLSGSIPPELSKLQALESLDLAFNSLTGSIPPEMASIRFLGNFNVSFNKGLTGPIPSGTQLEVPSSYLGDNKLCGLPKPPCEEKQIANHQNTSHQAHHRLHLVHSVQRWAALPGIAVGFILGFLCTVCIKLRSIKHIYCLVI